MGAFFTAGRRADSDDMAALLMARSVQGKASLSVGPERGPEVYAAIACFADAFKPLISARYLYVDDNELPFFVHEEFDRLCPASQAILLLFINLTRNCLRNGFDKSTLLPLLSLIVAKADRDMPEHNIQVLKVFGILDERHAGSMKSSPAVEADFGGHIHGDMRAAAEVPVAENAEFDKAVATRELSTVLKLLNSKALMDARGALEVVAAEALRELTEARRRVLFAGFYANPTDDKYTGQLNMDAKRTGEMLTRKRTYTTIEFHRSRTATAIIIATTSTIIVLATLTISIATLLFSLVLPSLVVMSDVFTFVFPP
jgi:hypothetical protein